MFDVQFSDQNLCFRCFFYVFPPYNCQVSQAKHNAGSYILFCQTLQTADMLHDRNYLS